MPRRLHPLRPRVLRPETQPGNGHNNTEARRRTTTGIAGGKGTTEPGRGLATASASGQELLLPAPPGERHTHVRAGDEFLQTQGGNNNPYNQDNATSWLDWDRLRVNQDVFRFFRCMIRFSKAHPSLGRSRFWRREWYAYRLRTVDMGPCSRTLAFMCGGLATGRRSIRNDQHVGKRRNLPDPGGRPGEWRQVLTRAMVSPGRLSRAGGGPALGLHSYIVRSRSVVGLVRG